MLVNGQGLLFIARALRDYDLIFGELEPGEASVRDVLIRELEPFIGIDISEVVRGDLNCYVSRILEAVYIRRIIDGDSSLLEILLEIPFGDGVIKVEIDPELKDEVRLLCSNKELIAKLINVNPT